MPENPQEDSVPECPIPGERPGAGGSSEAASESGGGVKSASPFAGLAAVMRSTAADAEEKRLARVEFDAPKPLPRVTAKLLHPAACLALVDDLQACFAREGLTDVCDFIREELTLDSLIRVGAGHVLVFLTSSGTTPELIASINEDAGRRKIIPIAVDVHNLISTGGLKLQVLPSLGPPISDWTFRAQALKSVARGFRDVLLNSLREPMPRNEDRISGAVTRRGFWSITHLCSWIAGNAVLGAVGGLVAARLTGFWPLSFVLLLFPLLWIFVPVGTALAGVECHARWNDTPRDRLNRCLKLLPRILLGLTIAYGLMDALIWADAALRGGRPPAELVRWLDLGVCGGALAGSVLYCSTRRATPVLFHPAPPPAPDDLFLARKGTGLEMNLRHGLALELPPQTILRMAAEGGGALVAFGAAFYLLNPKLLFGDWNSNYSLGLQGGLVSMCLFSGLFRAGRPLLGQREAIHGSPIPRSLRFKAAWRSLREAMVIPVHLAWWPLAILSVEILVSALKTHLDCPIFLTLALAALVFIRFRLAGLLFTARFLSR